MEKTATTPHFGLIDTFFFYLFSEWIVRVQKFFSKFFYKNPKAQNFASYELSTRPLLMDDNDNLSREDVEMVMERLGLSCSQSQGKKQQQVNSDEFSRCFEENEPSLEEVKAAFCVFDENRDGFIDAEELQRVLCVLGLREGLELGNCKEMITSFDENGDGKIDFNEFVKFMEDCLC